MSKLQLVGILCAGLVVIIVLVNVCKADNSRLAVQNVLNKLDAYALGSRRSSGLTIEELEAAYSEFENWDLKHQEVMKSVPLMRLLTDFLFYPMERFHDLIGDTEMEHTAYIKRLETNYKKFRPSYFGNMVGNQAIRHSKTQALFDSLFEMPNSKPLTIRLLNEAMHEYNAYTARIQEIPVYEDIYSALEEYEHLRNYQAIPWVQVLAESVFPSLVNVKEEHLPELKKFFATEMRKKGYINLNGQLTRIV